MRRAGKGWGHPSKWSPGDAERRRHRDRKSTRLNSSHLVISYAVFCLKKKIHHPLAYSKVFSPHFFTIFAFCRTTLPHALPLYHSDAHHHYSSVLRELTTSGESS